MRLGVQTADHHGVRVVADLVETDDEEGVHVLVERGGRAGVRVLSGLNAGRDGGVACGRHARSDRVHKSAARPLGRLLPYHICSHGAENQHQYDADNYCGLRAALCSLAALSRGGLPAAVFVSVHYCSTPFAFFRCITLSVQRATRLPAAQMCAGCVLGLGGRQPTVVLRPCQPPFVLAGRSFGVFRAHRGTLARQTRPPGLTPGNEDNAASGHLGPEKPCWPLYTEGIDFSQTYFVPAERMITQKIHRVQP